ncbi:metal-sensing transcriptional repressor [Patescibacteria group bacterium]|nr:metal-sensing transcriptional repressor [Patescibacteria group bacterium]
MKKGHKLCSSEKSLINLKKARSLLDKIITMKEDGKYCIDIMQQNLAAIGLLKSVNQSLMEGHLNTCFADAVKSKDQEKQDAMVKEIIFVTNLSNK